MEEKEKEIDKVEKPEPQEKIKKGVAIGAAILLVVAITYGFYEALKKLMDWKEEVELQTYGLSGFEECFEKQQYPGLGVVKKLALMHHIQLINDYLEDNN